MTVMTIAVVVTMTVDVMTVVSDFSLDRISCELFTN